MLCLVRQLIKVVPVRSGVGVVVHGQMETVFSGINRLRRFRGSYLGLANDLIVRVSCDVAGLAIDQDLHTFGAIKTGTVQCESLAASRVAG